MVARSGGVAGPGVDDAGHDEAEEGDQQHQRDPRHAEAGLHHRVDHRALAQRGVNCVLSLSCV